MPARERGRTATLTLRWRLLHGRDEDCARVLSLIRPQRHSDRQRSDGNRPEVTTIEAEPCTGRHERLALRHSATEPEVNERAASRVAADDGAEEASVHRNRGVVDADAVARHCDDDLEERGAGRQVGARSDQRGGWRGGLERNDRASSG